MISIKLLTQQFVSVDNPVCPAAYVQLFYLPVAGYYLWFLWALLWMFLIVGLFQSKRSRIVLLLITILLFFLPFDLPEQFCLDETKRFFVFFMLGCCAGDNRSSIEKFIDTIPVLAIAFVWAACLFIYFMLVRNIEEMVLEVSL